MDLQQTVDVYLRARYALVCIVTLEEDRVLAQLLQLCEQTKRRLYVWDHADFFKLPAGTEESVPTAKDPLSALETIEKIAGEAVFVLRDFHQCWHNQPRVLRKLRNVIQGLKYSRKTIIVTSPSATVPDELKDDAVILQVPLPDQDDLAAVLDHLAATPGVRINLSKEQRDRAINLALGLSAAQAQRAFAKAIVTDGAFDASDLDLIAREKREIVRGSGALEYFATDETLDDVGGLELLKEWLQRRMLAFSEAAQAYGLPLPKGITLIGIPGTGKSLTAKMVANLWHLPLIRLDVGALFGSLVGESEDNVRKALRLAEAVAPCVLWIDEMEKVLSVGDGDGGTGMRVLGTMLTWMQDRKQPVFIVATVNDVERLPPELLRRGRFDEIFFLDQPNKGERRPIFQVHLRKRGRDPANFDVNLLAAKSDGYVGAEIEQAIIDAMYLAFSDPTAPGREFTTADILTALATLVPLSRSQYERMEFLRSWVLEGRAQSASRADEQRRDADIISLQSDGRRTT